MTDAYRQFLEQKIKLDHATLRRLYVDEKLGCPEIGKQCGYDASTVRSWLLQAGIPTRGRGTDARQHFKKGQAAFRGRRHSPASIANIRQASLDRGAVPYMRNGQHWLKTVPPNANPKWKGGITPERQTFYRSPEWKAACVAVWHRADAKCERCGLDHRTVREQQKFHVHHLVSFAVVALRADPSNLVLLCRTCHLWVHSNANIEREFLDQDKAE